MIIRYLKSTHNSLADRFSWYEKWHLFGHSSKVHYASLSLVLITLLFGIYIQFADYQNTKASVVAEPKTQSLISLDTSGVYDVSDGEIEIVNQRTESFKTFKEPDGTFRVAGGMGPIHYKIDPGNASEKYKEIDLTIKETPESDWNYLMDKNGYQARFWNSKKTENGDVKYVAQFLRGGKWIEMAPVALVYQNAAGDEQTISEIKGTSDPIIDNNNYNLTWKNAFSAGIDFRYNVSPDKFFKTVIINDQSNLPEPTIDREGLKLSVIMSLSWPQELSPDNNFAKTVQTTLDDTAVAKFNQSPDESIASPEIAYRDDGEDLFWIREPLGWDSSGEQQFFDLSQEISRKGNSVFATIGLDYEKINPETKFPVYIDAAIAEEQVGAGADDGYHLIDLNNGGSHLFNASGTAVSIGWTGEMGGSEKRDLFTTFKTIPIPAGSTVTASTLSLKASGAQTSAGANWRINANAVDSAISPTDVATYNAKTRTTSYTDWSGVVGFVIGNWFQSPDISTVIQEVIGRGGWVSGNDLLLFTNNNGSSIGGYRQCYTYNYTGNLNGPKFNATYTTPATVPDPPTDVSASAGDTQATVSFTAPANNGGADITGYTVTSTPGSFTGTGASSPIDVTGLTNGVEYTFTVHATNSVGNSSESTASAAVTPVTPGVTVSGTVYTAEDKATNIGANKTVALSINGAAATTAETDANGAFSFSSITVVADNAVALYLDGETEKGSLVTQAVDESTDITTLELFTSHINLTHQTAGPITNTLLATADNVADTDLLVSVDGSSVATFTTGNTLWIITGKSYTPGGAVTVNNLLVAGTLDIAANALSISGNLTNTGTLTTSGTTTFNGTTTQAISPGSSSFTNVTVSNTSAAVSQAAATTITGTLTINASAIFATSGNNITIATLTNNGTFRETGGESTLTITNKDTTHGTIDYNGSGTYTSLNYGDAYNNLTFSGSGSYTFGASATVVGTTTVSAGTVTLANDTYILTTAPFVITGGTFTIANQGTTRTKLVATSFSLTTGTFNNGDYNYVDINGAFTQNSGTITNSVSAGRIYVSGDFNYISGTYPTTGATLLDGNSANFINGPNGFGIFYVSKTAGQTLTLLADLYVSGDFYYSSGTFATNGRTIKMVGDASNIYGGSTTVENLQISGLAVTTQQSINISSSLIVDADKKLVLGAGGASLVTLTDTARLTLNGTIDSYALNPGRIVFTDDAATNLTTSGTLMGRIRFVASAKNISIPARTYGGRVDIQNDSSTDRIATLGTAEGQTITFGNGLRDDAYMAGLIIITNGTGKMTVDSTVYNPTVNVITSNTAWNFGDIVFLGVGSGQRILNAGNSTWNVAGDIDCTNGVLNPGTSTFVLTGAGSQTQNITSSGQSFYNLTSQNTTTSGTIFADSATVTGTFSDITPSSKLTFHTVSTYTFANITISGQAAGTKIIMVSSSTGNHYHFNVANATPTVSYTNVKDADSSGGNTVRAFDGTNTDSLNNTNWVFTVAGAPTAVSAVGGNTSASVSFTAPVDTGGGTITGYTVTSTPGSLTGTGASSPITVTGLTNGTSYTFTVHATTIAGDSAESSASTAIVPATTPDPPTAVSATAGNTQATVSFSAPANNGGADITGYTVTSTPGSLTGTGASSPIDVTGLTNGVEYTFTVHATNSVGDSSESTASAAVTPAVPIAVPTVTTQAVSGADQTSATLHGTITATGGANATIRGFKYSSVGEQDDSEAYDTGEYSTEAYTELLESLTAGTTYYVRAYATNSAGTGYGAWVQFATSAPSIAFSATSSNGAESVSSVSIEVAISDISSTNSSVNYVITGTAIGGGTDYTLADGTATVTAGNLTTNVDLTVVADLLYENNETVIITLSDPTNATLGVNDDYTYTINNDDTAPEIGFGLTSATGPESTTSLNIVVNLSVESGLDATAEYTVSGSATGAGVDYTLANGTATISAGENSTNIALSIVNDALDENAENVIITLLNPTNSTLATEIEFTYTIDDNDNPQKITFNSASSSGSEATTPADIVVELASFSGKDITINYAVTDGTATGGGVDYTLATGTASIPAGSHSVNISPVITDDILDEDGETIIITISNPTNANLGATTEHVYTINDNDDPPTIDFALSADSGLESSTAVVLQIRLSAASSKDISVNYAVTGGTTTGGGVDYTLENGTATIAAGETISNISLTVINDTEVESDETIIIALSDQSNATLGSNSQLTYTIVNNDSPVVAASSDTASSAVATPTPAPSPTSSGVTAETTQIEQSTTQLAPQSSPESYNLSLIVVNDSGQPVAGARVELHSDVQVSYSDENGYAYFKNVAPGEHNVLVSYNNYSGEQKISASGNEQKIEVKITLEPNKRKSYQWLFIGVGAGILVIAIPLLVRFVRKRQTER